MSIASGLFCALIVEANVLARDRAARQMFSCSQITTRRVQNSLLLRLDMVHQVFSLRALLKTPHKPTVPNKEMHADALASSGLGSEPPTEALSSLLHR